MTEAQRIVAMAQRFHGVNNPPWPWNEADMTRLIEAMTDNPDCFVASTEKGFILAVIQPNPMSTEYIIAKEFLWWSEDNSGARLLRLFREWAKRRGADEIQYSCPAGNERVQRHYSRFAQPTETVYSEFPPCAFPQF